MPSERESRVRWSATATDGFQFVRRRRRGFLHLNGNFGHRTSHQHKPEVWVGNRGASHLRWRCGPREPPPSGGGLHRDGLVGGSFSLFVDGISESVSIRNLLELFSGYGKVLDTFISRKRRPYKNCRFGFVRFSHRREAEKAIADLNGWYQAGVKLSVSMAKYQKGGTPFTVKQVAEQRFNHPHRRTISAPLPVSSMFCEKVWGVQTKNSTVGNWEKIIPVLINIRFSESSDLASKLNFHIAVEKSEALISETERISIKAPDCTTSGSSSTSPTKLIVASKQAAGMNHRDEIRTSEISTLVDNRTIVSVAEDGVPMTNNNDYGADQVARSNGQYGSQKDKSEMNVQAPCLEAVPKLSTVAGLDAVTPHPERSETSQIIPTKKPKGKRALLNSKDIAEYLGYYTKRPSPAEASQKH
ncbi:unnamed protein product [Amaranthus hypochondriacus]